MDQTGHIGSNPVTAVLRDNDRIKRIHGLDSFSNSNREYCCFEVFHGNMRFSMVLKPSYKKQYHDMH